METRSCQRCHITKPEESFSRDLSQPRGKDRICRECRALRQKEHRDRRRAAREAANLTDGQQRDQNLNFTLGRHCIPKPKHDFGMHQHGIVRVGDQLYRILILNETHAKLSNGEWVLRHTLNAA